MKYVIIVPDGMADNPIESIGNKTPLDVARTTNMDFLAKNGMTGLIKTIPDGMKPGSDVGNLSLLGYDPKLYITGRAPLEAANMNVSLADDEVAVRCNFVTVENGAMVDYSAGHIQTKEAAVLIDALNQKMDLPDVKFYAGKSYRHLLVVKSRSAKEYCNIKTTPPHDIMGQQIQKYLPEGAESEMLLKLMEKSKEILQSHSVNKVRLDLEENPANMIWLWGQGTSPNIPSFNEKFDTNGGIISAVDLVNGIGRLAGLEVIDVPGATGYYDTDYAAKARYALDYLKSNDFVFIHVEATDEAGHNGDLNAKIEAIERIDKDIVGPVLNHFDNSDDVRILILPDHPTPVELRTHTSNPVEFVMYGKGISHDGSTDFSAPTCQENGVKFESGEAIIEHFMRKFI